MPVSVEDDKWGHTAGAYGIIILFVQRSDYKQYEAMQLRCHNTLRSTSATGSRLFTLVLDRYTSVQST